MCTNVQKEPRALCLLGLKILTSADGAEGSVDAGITEAHQRRWNPGFCACWDQRTQSSVDAGVTEVHQRGWNPGVCDTE